MGNLLYNMVSRKSSEAAVPKAYNKKKHSVETLTAVIRLEAICIYMSFILENISILFF